MREVDYIVVGGGIAGSLLSFDLMDKGKKVVLFDNANVPGSSTIAAGSINPITGRRFVKSWRIDELLEYVRSLYSKIEKHYSVSIIHEQQIIRGIKNTGMLNDWSARMLDTDFSNYIGQKSIECPNGIVDSFIDCVEIQKGYRIDFIRIMALVKAELNHSESNFNEHFDYNKLKFGEDQLIYGTLKSKNIIFTEGAIVRNNPFWNWLPFIPARGERLVISAPGLKMSCTFNDGKIIIPLGADQYWVGSNYDWDNLEPVGTSEGLQELSSYLDKTLTVPYEIIDHAGHVRPSTYNRRPFIGRHPEIPNLFILNGLGAKGASLAPYCVQQLLGHILNGNDIDPEIDVARVKQVP